MSRLFTFGCSFTAYAWPTWANIIAYDKKIPFYNYADAGMGNVGIAHRILEADLKHNFNKDDQIYILWTSWTREDRIKEDFWNCKGSVFNTQNNEYFGYFLRKYWSMNNDIVKNSHAIISTNRMFKDNILWQGCAYPFHQSEEGHLLLTDINKQLINLYNKQLPDIEYINLDYELEKECAFEKVRDPHPDVKRHLEFANHIYNKTAQTMKKETIMYFEEIQVFFENYVIENNIDNLDDLVKVMPKFFMKFKEMIPLMNQSPLNKYLPELHRA